MSYIGNNVQPVNNFGESGGDFDGVSILDNVVKGNLALSTQEINKEARDINNRIQLSDSPREISLFASTVGQAFTIDTQGYQSIHVTTRAFAGGVTGSNDQVTYGSLVIVNPASLATSTAVAANTNYIVPCSTRYVRFTATTAGSFVYTLRNTPPSIGAQNLALIGGAAVAVGSAQLGINLVNIGGTANASQAGTLTLGTTAANNGMTNGTVIAPLTVAATVIKATAGKLYSLSVGNAQATAIYLKVYNAASVTLGTTTPVQNYLVPANSTFNVTISPVGLYFATGICVAVTGGQPLLDTTALTSTAVVNYSFI